MSKEKNMSDAPERIYCNNCSNLIPHEEWQTGKKERHICMLYKRPVLHLGEHPKLLTLDWCVRHEHYIKDMQDATKHIREAWNELAELVGIDTANALARNADAWRAIKADLLEEKQ